MIQLDFFKEFSKEELMSQEIDRLKQSQAKVRKALFARHGELAKMYIEIKEDLDILKRNICREKNVH